MDKGEGQGKSLGGRLSLQYERPPEGPPETDNACASGRVLIPGTKSNNPAFSRSSNEYVLA